MKHVVAVCACLLVVACASTAGRTGPPTCTPTVGMAESVFLDCACFRPYFNPDRGAALVSNTHSTVGISKTYACMQSPAGEPWEVRTLNGSIISVHR